MVQIDSLSDQHCEQELVNGEYESNYCGKRGQEGTNWGIIYKSKVWEESW